MPSTTDARTPTTTSKFWTIYEALVVLFFIPAAFGINKIIHIVIASDPPFWMLPIVLGFFVGLTLLVSTPKQPWTPVTLALELTGITEGTLISNSVSGTPFMAVAILCAPFWFFMIFLVLSVKGVRWDEMGHIGTIADGVEFTAKKITGFVKGIGLLIFTMLDKLRLLAGELWGIGETSELSARDIEAVTEAPNCGSQANLPPPYYVSILSDSHIFSKAIA